MWLNSGFLFVDSSTISSGVDNVGTVSASLVTYASIQALQPDLVINAGTAGGFKVCSLLQRTIIYIDIYVCMYVCIERERWRQINYN